MEPDVPERRVHQAGGRRQRRQFLTTCALPGHIAGLGHGGSVPARCGAAPACAHAPRRRSRAAHPPGRTFRRDELRVPVSVRRHAVPPAPVAQIRARRRGAEAGGRRGLRLARRRGRRARRGCVLGHLCAHAGLSDARVRARARPRACGGNHRPARTHELLPHPDPVPSAEFRDAARPARSALRGQGNIRVRRQAR
jgi:hypothetical protein